MILLCIKFPEILRYTIYYEQIVIVIRCFRPIEYGDFQMSRMTVITLFLSFLSFSCDFLASMISTNIANIAIHWLCFLLTYDIENYSQYVLEFIFSVLALNACMSVVAGLKEKLQMMLKNFEKIVQVHMELLNGLKEGFIALT